MIQTTVLPTPKIPPILVKRFKASILNWEVVTSTSFSNVKVMPYVSCLCLLLKPTFSASYLKRTIKFKEILRSETYGLNLWILVCKINILCIYIQFIHLTRLQGLKHLLSFSRWFANCQRKKYALSSILEEIQFSVHQNCFRSVMYGGEQLNKLKDCDSNRSSKHWKFQYHH